MAKSDFLLKQKLMRQTLLDVGVKTGRQQVTDVFLIALADYEVMGNKKLRPEELEKVLHKTEELLSYFHTAFEKNDEADYFQEKLDKALREAVPEEKFNEFHERYPYCKEYNYNTGRWS